MSLLYWSSSIGSIAAIGETEAVDVGTGEERYSRARESLERSRGQVAFASFAFDIEDPFSVVMIPPGTDRSWQPSTGGIPRGTVVTDGADEWVTGFDGAMTAIGAGRAQKVVLARQVTAQFDSDVPVESVLARLVSDNPSSHVFSIDGLVGASPELLVRVLDSRVTSLVLAGTSTSVEGLETPIISAEHGYAASSVEESLRPLTTGLSRERSPIVYGRISHLGTRFEATALPGIGVLDLVASLHPTAAVCGTPSDSALELIRDLEPRSRGRYAGPVGWFDTEGNGEFAIALRCAQILGDRATLYAGGGLVEGSQRGSEWEETSLKLTPMLRALGLSG